jgi:hypothetical protein
LLLMPQSGLPTDLVFWAAAEPLLTTESFWSVKLMTFGESRTLGEQLGERVAISDLPKETPALCAVILPIPPSDVLIHHH